MNQLSFSARIFEKAKLRQTPAGVDVLNLVLQHNSVVQEADVPRTLDFYLEARAMGESARNLAKLRSGARIEIKGFIAPLRRNSSHFIVNIQEAKAI